MAAPATIHASCISVGDAGVLIRGPSGAGKSWLALGLILDPPRALPAAELVADDRVLLAREGADLVARPAPSLAGLIEARGLGIRRMPHRAMVAVRWVIDLAAEDAARMPDCAALQIALDGLLLPRIPATEADQARLLLTAALASHDPEN